MIAILRKVDPAEIRFGGCPSWLKSGFFDVVAKVPEGTTSHRVSLASSPWTLAWGTDVVEANKVNILPLAVLCDLQ
jgi:hypothetical protein